MLHTMRPLVAAQPGQYFTLLSVIGPMLDWVMWMRLFWLPQAGQGA